MKLTGPAYRQAGIPLGRDRHAGASWKGNLIFIVPLDPAYPARAGLVGHLPVSKVKRGLLSVEITT